MSRSYNTIPLTNINGITASPIFQCESMVCSGPCITSNISFNDCDASVAHIGNLYTSGNVYMNNLKTEYADHILFYNSTTGEITNNHSYFISNTTTTFVSEYYGFEVNASLTYNIVGGAVCVSISYDPYIYFQNVANCGVWTTNNNPLAGIAPQTGMIYPVFCLNGVSGGYTQLLMRVFDNGNIQLENPSGSFPTYDTQTLNIFPYSFNYIMPQ